VSGVIRADPAPSAQAQRRRPISIPDLEALVARPAPTNTWLPGLPMLRCVSSGYLGNGCSCEARIPAEVVHDAWARERTGEEDRFFEFSCRGETWLAYGQADGRVRGVYCPEHRAEREERATLDRIEDGATDGEREMAA
jgi:hypothetical protein